MNSCWEGRRLSVNSRTISSRFCTGRQMEKIVRFGLGRPPPNPGRPETGRSTRLIGVLGKGSAGLEICMLVLNSRYLSGQRAMASRHPSTSACR